MKRITYSERASFYYKETYSDIDHSFLREIIQIYSINSVLDIPCGAGRNLYMLAQSCKLAMFGDAEKNMVCQVEDKIRMYNFENCKCICADINNYHLEEKVDMTIVMRQALQLFPVERIKSILENLISNTLRILVLDIYNFNKNTLIGQMPEYLQEKEKVFTFNKETIVRISKLEVVNEGILINYTYKRGIKKWETRFKLYNLDPEYIKQLLSTKNPKRIIEYRDYSFNLRKKNENSAILVIEL